MKKKLSFILLIIIACAATIYAQAPTVTFTETPTSACAGSVINFTNTSTNGPTSWTWYFPYGTPSFYTTTVSPGNPPAITYNYPGTYSATCVVRNSFGSDSLTVPNCVSIIPAPTIAIYPPSGGICDTSHGAAFDTIYFTTRGLSSNTYSWAPFTYLSCSACPNPHAYPVVTTVYTCTVTGLGGCTALYYDTVTVGDIKAKITGLDSICAGYSDTLIASGGASNASSNTIYIWSNGKTTSEIVVNPTITTSYTVTVTSGAGGCPPSKAVFTVHPFLKPNFTLTGPDSICFPGSATIVALPNSYQYYWYSSTGELNGNAVIVSPSTNTTYTLEIKNMGCTFDSLIKVKVNNPPTVFFTGATNLCQGSSTLICATGGTEYHWSTGGTTSCVSVSPTASKTYTVQVRSGACFKDTTFTIIVDTMPNVRFSGDTSLCVGDTGIIYASGGNSYLWSDGSTFDSIAVIGWTPGLYKFYVTATKGACSKDSVLVTVAFNFCAGIQNYSNTLGLHIFPNPVNNKLSLQSDNPINGNSALTITDVTGRLLYIENSTSDRSEFDVDVSSLAPAIYFLKLQTSEGIVVKKFLKE